MVRHRDPYNILNDEIKSVGKRLKNVIERIPWIELMLIILECSPSTECMFLNGRLQHQNYQYPKNVYISVDD
jgi:hypothetical protein